MTPTASKGNSTRAWRRHILGSASSTKIEKARVVATSGVVQLGLAFATVASLAEPIAGIPCLMGLLAIEADKARQDKTASGWKADGPDLGVG